MYFLKLQLVILLLTLASSSWGAIEILNHLQKLPEPVYPSSEGLIAEVKEELWNITEHGQAKNSCGIAPSLASLIHYYLTEKTDQPAPGEPCDLLAAEEAEALFVPWLNEIFTDAAKLDTIKKGLFSKRHFDLAYNPYERLTSICATPGEALNSDSHDLNQREITAISQAAARILGETPPSAKLVFVGNSPFLLKQAVLSLQAQQEQELRSIYSIPISGKVSRGESRVFGSYDITASRELFFRQKTADLLQLDHVQEGDQFYFIDDVRSGTSVMWVVETVYRLYQERGLTPQISLIALNTPDPTLALFSKGDAEASYKFYFPKKNPLFKVDLLSLNLPENLIVAMNSKGGNEKEYQRFVAHLPPRLWNSYGWEKYLRPLSASKRSYLQFFAQEVKSCLSPQGKSGVIKEISSLTQLAPFVDATTVVISDLDETLILNPGSTTKHRKKSDRLVYCEGDCTKMAVKEIAEKSMAFTVLTARGWYPSPPVNQTPHELYGHRLVDHLVDYCRLPLSQLAMARAEDRYYRGVFFAEGGDKGEKVLKILEILAKQGLKPSKIIFVDDRHDEKCSHLREVQAALESINYGNFQLFHYIGTMVKSEAIDTGARLRCGSMI